jgi:hypothetical protein
MIEKYVRLRNVDSVLECFDDVIFSALKDMGGNRNATIGNIVDYVNTQLAGKDCPHGCKVTFLPEDETVTYDISVITRYDNEGSSSEVDYLGTVTWRNRKIVRSELTV